MVLLSAVWVLIFVATLAFLTYVSNVFNSSPEVHTILSISWSGYLVANDSNTALAITSLSGSWVVPQMNTSGGDGFSSAWIGIGGQTDQTLIQVGTEHDVENGQVTYRVWYETLPILAVTIPSITVSPGDTIQASITLTDEANDVWTIQISDQTNGQSYNTAVTYNSTRSSAEWIIERPTINGQISTLSDFGSIAFSGCKINDAQPIGSFVYSNIKMSNSQGVTLTDVSSLGSDGASFSVTFVSGN